MAKKNYIKGAKATEKIMRMRFIGMSCLIIGLNIFESNNVELQLVSLALVVFISFMFTLSGKILLGTWLNKEKWRTLNAPQKTVFFNYFIGLPVSAILLFLYASGYSNFIADQLIDVFFPPDQNISESRLLTVIHEQLRGKTPLVISAGLFYSGLVICIGTIIKNLQLSSSLRILKRLRNSADARRVLDQISWDQFEKLVCKFFEGKGYKARVTASGPDGGVDVELRRSGRKEMVQCKHWKATRVGVSVVREIIGVIQIEKYQRGFIITSGLFSQDAWDYAKRPEVAGKVILIDGTQLLEIIKGNTDVQHSNATTDSAPIDINTRSCPACSAPMVIRKSEGKAFLSCSQFPDCKGTEEI